MCSLIGLVSMCNENLNMNLGEYMCLKNRTSDWGYQLLLAPMPNFMAECTGFGSLC